MFSPAKFVIIDNDESHLKAVASAIGSLGAGCRTIHYTAEDGAGEIPMNGVRIVFTDLHLVTTASATTDNSHYATIAGILDELVPFKSGPYVVCLWTRHPDELVAFRDYVDARMGAEGQVNRPLKIFSLNKTEYIKLESGQSLPNTTLSNDIVEKLIDVPQLCALMGFESDIIKATDSTLAKIREHASRIDPASVHIGLDLLLNHLGDAAVGNSNLHSDVRRAIHSAIFPLLADEAINCVQTGQMTTAWANSVTVREHLAPLPLDQSAELTYSIHTAVDREPDPANWGMVSTPSKDLLNDQPFIDRFGMSPSEFLKDEAGLKEDHRQVDKIRFIRAGASCDFAQQKKGPIQCVLGIEAKQDHFSKDKWGQKKSWRSPFISTGGGQRFQLWFFPLFSFTASVTEIALWQPQYRLRNDILMELTNKVTAHHARPGIARFIQDT